MSASDLAIVTALIFAWGALSARLERFDVTAPITFVLAGVVLTHGPLAPLGFAPSHETVKGLAEFTLVLVLFSDASRVDLRDLRSDMGLCVRLLGIGGRRSRSGGHHGHHGMSDFDLVTLLQPLRCVDSAPVEPGAVG